MWKILPIKNRVAFKKIEGKTITDWNFKLPEDKGKDACYMGKVIAIGPEVKTIKVGDTIIYYRHDSWPYFLNDEEIIICQDKFILATVN